MATPTSLPASFTAGDILTAANMNNIRGGFRILQFLSASSTTPQSSSSTTYADLTSFSISITPQATSNKILVVYMTTIEKSAGNANNAVNMRILRGATTIATWTNGLFTNSLLRVIAPASYLYLDSPATTSATTYKMQFANVNNGAEISVQQGSAPGEMYLLEISL